MPDPHVAFFSTEGKVIILLMYNKIVGTSPFQQPGSAEEV